MPAPAEGASAFSPSGPLLFVSYAREDSEFVERLAAALGAEGLEVWVDTAGLFVGEEFWDRICAVIDGAEAVICVLSRHYARSVWCRREAEYAESRSKRILPVVIDAVGTSQLPAPVRVRNWLSFTAADSFEESVEALIAAGSRDPAWIHEHTRLFARASDWERRGRSTSLLLRGQELEEAKSWLTISGQREPRVHPLHLEFIETSEREELEEGRRAEVQRRVSLSRALVARADLMLARSDGPALVPALLAAHAFRGHPSPEGYAVLRRALGLLPPCRPRLDHPYRVGAVAFSPDGSLLATGAGMTREEEMAREYTASARGPDLEDIDEYSPGIRRLQAEAGRGSVAFDARIWETASGHLRNRLPHRGRVRAIAFLPDGSGLVTACEDGAVTVWSVDGAQRRAVFGHPGPAWFAAVSPDGARLFVVAEDERDAMGALSAYLWSLADGREELRVPLRGWEAGGPYLRRELRSFAPSLRLDRLAVAFGDGALRVFGLGDGALLLETRSGSDVHSLAFSPDERHLAIGEDRHLRVLDASNGEEIAACPHPGSVTLLRWNQHGDRIVTASSTGPVGWAARIAVCSLDGSTVWSRQVPGIRDVAVAPDGTSVAAAGATDLVPVYELGPGGALRAELHFTASANAVTFSPDGSLIAAGSDDLSARVWQAVADLDVIRLELDESAHACALSPSGRFVAVAGSATCRIFEVATGDCMARKHLTVDRLQWTPDEAFLVLTTSTGVRMHDMSTGKERRLRHNGVRRVVFSPDVRYLVTAGADRPQGGSIVAGCARIWRASDGQLLRKVPHSDTAFAAAAHPDGNRFATAAGPPFGHDIVISRAGRGRDIWVAIGAPAHDLAFSVDGKLLAVGFHELGVGLFSVQTGRERARFDAPEVLVVTFDPTGRFFAASGQSFSDRGVPTPWTQVFGIDDPTWPGSIGEPVVSLPGESLLGFVAAGAFLATRAASTVRIRDPGSWEAVCTFEGVESPKQISLETGLVARLEPDHPGSRLVVSRWTPQDLMVETTRRLPRDLSADEWQQQAGNEPMHPLFGA